jgi:hypothetical protein
MSYIAFIEGELQFDSDDAFEQMVDRLNPWDGEFYTDVPNRRIEFEGTYRNLGRHTEELLDTASGGYLIGHSNDTSWHGFVATPAGETEYDLETYADEHVDVTPPETDFSSHADAYSHWQLLVEQDFLLNMRAQHAE